MGAMGGSYRTAIISNGDTLFVPTSTTQSVIEMISHYSNMGKYSLLSGPEGRKNNVNKIYENL